MESKIIEKTGILEKRTTELEKGNEKLEKIRIALLNMLKDLNQIKKELEGEKSQLELKIAKRTRRLEEEKKVLETIIENIAYGILVVDPANRILLANSVIETLLGVEKSDLLGSLVAQIIEDIELLGKQPEMGRVVPEFELDDLRELIRPPFRIVYRRDRKKVRIVRIWRSERLLMLPE